MVQNLQIDVVCGKNSASFTKPNDTETYQYVTPGSSAHFKFTSFNSSLP